MIALDKGHVGNEKMRSQLGNYEILIATYEHTSFPSSMSFFSGHLGIHLLGITSRANLKALQPSAILALFGDLQPANTKERLMLLSLPKMQC